MDYPTSANRWIMEEEGGEGRDRLFLPHESDLDDLLAKEIPSLREMGITR